MTAAISMRELQKMSAEKIRALKYPTPIKSGGETVAMLVPRPNERAERLRAVVEKAAELSAKQSPEDKARIIEVLGFDPE